MTCRHCRDPLPENSRSAYCHRKCADAAAWIRRKNDPDRYARHLEASRARHSPEKSREKWVRRRESPEYRAQHPGRADLMGPECSEAECDRKPVARDLCPRHYRQLMKREGRTWAADTDHASRARRAGVQYQPINRLEIFERDRWICQLCSEPVNPALAFPHRGSASLDHVVPISRGGDHVPGNVQLAHMGCNTVKHDGGIQEHVEDVLALSAAGLSRPEIADAVGVSVRTVAWIRKHYATTAPTL